MTDLLLELFAISEALVLKPKNKRLNRGIVIIGTEAN